MRERLKKIRLSKGLTQRQVAEMAGVSVSYFTEVETGKKQMNERLLERIAKALKVSKFDILEPDELGREREELISLIGQMDAQDRSALIQMAKAILRKRA